MKFIEQEFPSLRFRRNRKSEKIRNLISETNIRQMISFGRYLFAKVIMLSKMSFNARRKRRSIDRLVEAASEAFDLGIPAICLFPYTEQSLRTEDCAEAWNPDNLSNKATRAIKKAVPDLVVMSDVALDPIILMVMMVLLKMEKLLTTKRLKHWLNKPYHKQKLGWTL